MPDNEVDGAADVDTDKPDDAAGSTKYSHRLQDELNQLET